MIRRNFETGMGRTGRPGEKTSEESFRLFESAHGKVYHCPEFGRFVVDFKGTYLVLRNREFFGLQSYLAGLSSCVIARSEAFRNGELMLRDSLSGNALALNRLEIEKLSHLMDSVPGRLENSDPGEQPIKLKGKK